MANTTAEQLTNEMFDILQKFFGSMQYGIHAAATDTYKEWCCTAAKLLKEPEANWQREAVKEDAAYCLQRNMKHCKDIFVRPSYDIEQFFILFDDLTAEQVNKYIKQPGTLIITSSPGRFQVWQHSNRPLTYDEKKELIRRAGADLGATPTHRWGRCPGYKNFKAKYAPKFPYARLVKVSEGLATLPDIELPAKTEISQPEQIKHVPKVNKGAIDKIRRADYDKGDESQTDFCYTLALLRRGASDSDIKNRIFAERTAWRHKPSDIDRERYLNLTIRKAREFAGL